MKKILVLLLCCAVFLTLAAYDGVNCGAPADAEGNDLFAGASPETSAMGLRCFNDINGERGWIYDTAREKEILSELSAVSAVPARNWTPDDITFPVFMLEIGSTEGFGVHAAWSNGYLILRDGSAWRFAYDFAALWESDYADVDIRSVALVNAPCARKLLEGKSGWYVPLMTPAGHLQPPEGIAMELVDWSEDIVTVRLTNSSDAEFVYGEAFSLHVLLDGSWYVVPRTSEENWAFNSVAKLLAAGEERNETYPLLMYGDLPEGQYRLAVEGLSVEGEIE